jgi:phasin
MSDVEKIPVTKTAKKATAPKTETFEAFSMSQVDMPEMFRDVAEKSVKQARDSYDRLRAAAEEATDVLEDQFETTRTGFVALNSKALDAAKANADATFQFARDVLTVKSVAEAIELQTAFARHQFEIVSAQTKEMHELLTKVATESANPVKDVFSKFMKDLKVA